MNILKTLAILAISIPSIVFAQAAIRSTAPSDAPTIGAQSEAAKPETAGIEHEDIGITGKDIDDDGDSLDDSENFTVDSFFDIITDIELTEEEDMRIGGPNDNEARIDSFFDVFVDYSDEETKEVMDSFNKEDDESGARPAGRSSKPKEIVVVGSKAREKVKDGKAEVRGWDPEKKEVTMEPEDIEKVEDFLDFIGAVVISDENIENVSLNFEKIRIEYAQPAKLFWFIPMSLTAQVELSEKEKVKVKFPWYTFLTKNNAKKIKKEIKNAAASAQWNETNLEFLQQRARKFQVIGNIMKASRDTLKAIIQNVK